MVVYHLNYDIVNTKKIEQLLDQLQYVFQVQNYDKEIVILSKDNDAMAEILFDEEYQRITIYIYPIFFKHKESEQRKALLHELCHTITIPQKRQFVNYIDGENTVTKDTITQTMERATSQIENILDKLFQGKMDYAKKAYNNYLTKDMKKKCGGKKGGKRK